MEMVDLSRLIYDGMPKIPVLPDVHVQKFLSLEKGHPLNVTDLLALSCRNPCRRSDPYHAKRRIDRAVAARRLCWSGSCDRSE